MVQGNPRVYKALKTEFATVLAELKRIEAGKGVDDELLSVIELISIILGGLKGEDANGELKRNDYSKCICGNRCGTVTFQMY